MEPDEPHRPPEHVGTRPATAHECVATATRQAAVLAAMLQQANQAADPLLHLLLLPLIKDAVELGQRLRAIEVALETT